MPFSALPCGFSDIADCLIYKVFVLLLQASLYAEKESLYIYCVFYFGPRLRNPHEVGYGIVTGCPQSRRRCARIYKKNSDMDNEAHATQLTPYKEVLFRRLRALVPARSALVVELGIGLFVNAPYYEYWEDLQVVGIEPDTNKHSQAEASAAASGVRLRMHSCRAEQLPLAENSADAVVSTYALCTIDDPRQALAEVKRVLKADGVFAFLEHVRSETDECLAARQTEATPEELRCWGCHLDRRTLQHIEAAAFSRVIGAVGDQCYHEVPTESTLMSPTVVGFAFP